MGGWGGGGAGQKTFSGPPGWGLGMGLTWCCKQLSLSLLEQHDCPLELTT